MGGWVGGSYLAGKVPLSALGAAVVAAGRLVELHAHLFGVNGWVGAWLGDV